MAPPILVGEPVTVLVLHPDPGFTVSSIIRTTCISIGREDFKVNGIWLRFRFEDQGMMWERGWVIAPLAMEAARILHT